MANQDNEVHRTKSADLLHATIGDFGLWQCRISILMALLKLPIAWFQLGIVFLAPPTDFWCKPPVELANISAEVWKGLILAKTNGTHRDSHQEKGFCKMIDSNSNSLIDCPWGYDYNRTLVYSSIISEWNLVCGRERLIDVTQITLMLGVLLGVQLYSATEVPRAIVFMEITAAHAKCKWKSLHHLQLIDGSTLFGIAADKVGRKPILITCIFVQSICGILSSISPWFSLFLVLRFFLAVANGGTMIISFVMCMELVGGKWRTIVPILYQIPFGMGNTFMSLIAYVLRDWRELQFTLSAISTFYITYLWTLCSFVPESPRWLIAVGKKQLAAEILEKAAICNGLDVSNVRKCFGSFHDRNSLTIKPKMAHFFQSSEIRKRTFLLSVNWFLAGISFFAFSQYLGQVSNNLYFAVGVGGLISMPGTFLCIFIIKRYGRKATISMANIMTAFCFVAILFVPKGLYYQDWPRIALAALGVIGMSIAIPALYLFTGELYPTILRNAGVGAAVTCSKIGSMLAPLVISLSDIETYIPLIILGCLSIAEALLVLPLPETLDKSLPETIQDIDKLESQENTLDHK